MSDNPRTQSCVRTAGHHVAVSAPAYTFDCVPSPDLVEARGYIFKGTENGRQRQGRVVFEPGEPDYNEIHF